MQLTIVKVNNMFYFPVLNVDIDIKICSNSNTVLVRVHKICNYHIVQ